MESIAKKMAIGLVAAALGAVAMGGLAAPAHADEADQDRRMASVRAEFDRGEFDNDAYTVVYHQARENGNDQLANVMLKVADRRCDMGNGILAEDFSCVNGNFYADASNRAVKAATSRPTCADALRNPTDAMCAAYQRNPAATIAHDRTL